MQKVIFVVVILFMLALVPFAMSQKERVGYCDFDNQNSCTLNVKVFRTATIRYEGTDYEFLYAGMNLMYFPVGVIRDTEIGTWVFYSVLSPMDLLFNGQDTGFDITRADGNRFNLVIEFERDQQIKQVQQF